MEIGIKDWPKSEVFFFYLVYLILWTGHIELDELLGYLSVWCCDGVLKWFKIQIVNNLKTPAHF